MALVIPVQDNPNHSLIVEIEQQLFTLRFLYNALSDRWYFDLLDGEEEGLVYGVKIIPNYPLLFYHQNNSFPDGDFYCQAALSSVGIGRNSFTTAEAELLYLTPEEISTL